MKHRFKNTLRAMAKHLGLKVKYVSYLDAHTHGRLLVREKRILINAHKPRTEHVFTMLHEIGHFVVHHQKPHAHCPWYFRKDWHNEFLDGLCFKARRYLRFMFNRTAGREWEADMWALCAFIVLSKHLGCRAELLKFLERHPEKLNTLLLVTGALAYTNVKSRLHGLAKKLSLPALTNR
jgi:hypothetical protein